MHNRLSLKLSLVLTLLLAAAISSDAQQHVSNPFAGATQYLNPDYTKEVQTIAARTNDANLAAQMKTVTSYPTAVWLDRIAAIAGNSAAGGRLGLAEHLDTALAQQQGATPIVVTIVVYDLPGRDCAALASNGELSIAANPPTQPQDGVTTYKAQFIDPIVSILSNPKYANIRIVAIIEPDSLPNLVTNLNLQPCALANSSGAYVQSIQYALTHLHQIPNVYLYLDIGHSAWLGWPSNMGPAVTLFTNVAKGTTAGLASVDGFITDTANYTPTKEPFMTANQSINGNQLISANFYQFNPFIDEAGYAAALYQNFVNAGWPASIGLLIDTSRNGWGGPNRPTGPSTSTDVNTFVDATRIDRRNHRGQWCNQSGAGLGQPPLASPPGFFSQLQAFVWIKPPGESDGTYPGSANQDGAIHADPNCDPAHMNSLAGNTLTGSIPNSPPAGQFFPTEFVQLIQNAFPAVPTSTAPDFSISANGTSVMQASSASTSVSILPVNNFSGAVALSVTGLPAGVTASFSSSTVTGAAVSTLSFTASATATVGTATVNVVGTSGSLSHSFPIQLTVIGRPDFSITAAPPAAVTLTPGSNPTATVTVASLFGFTGSVSISAAGLPAGVSANFSPSSVNGSGSIVVNFNAQTNTPAGTTNISIVGTSGSLTHSATIALTVTGTQPDFSLTANPATLSVAQGGTSSSAIGVGPLNGFTGSVALAASGLPAGVTATFSPASTTGTSTLTLTASSTATIGTTTITITGSSGTLTHSTSITVTVTGNQPDFSLSASPASLSLAQGGTASSTIAVTALNGFSGSVALSAAGLPSGVTASFSPASTTGTSTLVFTASSTSAAGTANVTVTGTGGGLSHTASIALTITTTTQGNGGVTVATVINANGPFYDDEGVKISNTAPITALSITINVQNTGGLSFNGQYNTVGTSIVNSHSNTATVLTYQFSLAPGQTLSPGTGYLFDAQMSGTGTSHPTSGDTFTVSYTTGGQTFTQTGHF